MLCCVLGVLGHLAPVHRCACSVCCFAHVCVCGCVLTCPSVTAGRALPHPDGGCFVAGRSWVRCRARTRPSGRRVLRSRQGRVSLPGAHRSIQTAAGGLWLWPGRSNRPHRRFLVRRTVPVAVLLFLRVPPGFVRPCCACILSFSLFSPFFSRPPCGRLSLFRPQVPWASALFGCPPLVPSFRPPHCVRLSIVFGPWCPRAGRFLAALPPPPFFLVLVFAAPLVSAFLLLAALGALGLGALWLSAPASSFFFSPVVRCAAVPCCCVLSFVVSSVVVRCCVLWCFLWCCVGLLCALSSRSLVRRVGLRCVGCVGLSSPLPLSAAAFVLGPVAAAWSGFLLCLGVRCPAVLLRRLPRVVLLSASFPAVWCSVVPFALAGAVCFCLLFLGVRCWTRLTGGVFFRWCLCLAAWPAVLLCAVVCGGALLPCAVSCGALFPRAAVLLCFAVCFALLVVFVCSLPCSGVRGCIALLCCRRCVVCCSPCCVLRRLLCGAVLRCAGAPAFLPCVVHCCFCGAGRCPVVLPVVSGCSSLGLVVCCCFWLCVAVSASLVLPCCVLRCFVVPCCPVQCPVVLCCLLVLCCSALLVLGGALLYILPCWWCLFVSFSLKNLCKTCKEWFSIFENKSKFYTTLHTRQDHQHTSVLRVSRQPP